jgi:hypothetical protein
MIEWSTIPPISTKPTTTWMVNNSTNINKTNNHLNGQQYRQYQQSPEWSTISSISTTTWMVNNIASINNHLNGQQYRQYQPNEQPPLTSNNWIQKKRRQHNLWHWKFRSWLWTGTMSFMCYRYLYISLKLTKVETLRFGVSWTISMIYTCTFLFT